MILSELLFELRQKDIHLYLHDGNLRGKAPPHALTPQLKMALQARKTELIEYFREIRSLNVPPLLPAPHKDFPPLSYSQERLWFLDQLEPGNSSYNMWGGVRLIGELDTEVLKKSLDEIVRRHEVLRTTFTVREGQAVQVIAPVLELDLPVVDLSGLPESMRETEARLHLERIGQQPFDLTAGPLVRAGLLFLGNCGPSGNAEHILAFTLHHIVSDGWSTGILVREFMTLYQAFNAGKASLLPKLPIQYADYAVWQRQYLQGERLEQQLDYWKRQLAGAPSVLELPTDHPRPAVQSYRGAIYRFTVPQDLTGQLRVLSRQQDVTLFMTLLAAFNVLLSCYSGQKDLCIGTPVANRNRLEIEGLIGFFVNTLVMRTDLSGNPAFTTLLRKVMEACLRAQANQELPFEKLVEELAPVRDMGCNPLFQVMLSLQSTPELLLEIEGLQAIPVDIESNSAKFDLNLEITEGQGKLTALFNYNTDLFDESSIARMGIHYVELLRNIVGQPWQCLSELQFLPELERRQLLVGWNETEAGYPRGKCLHELFEEQARRSPEVVAVVFGGEELTYGQLNGKANQLARYLRSKGAGPEVIVGICVERSVEMVVGLLGILKAGGAYLPIDPQYPKERIAHALQHAKPRIVLTQGSLKELVSGVKQFFLDLQWGELTEEKSDDLETITSSGNLAYVIYTSGSTGQSKGVGVTHENIVHSTSARLQYYQAPITGFLLLSSIAFDSSMAGIFGTLCQGGRLVLLPQGATFDTRALSHLIFSHRVSHLLAVPSLYEALLQEMTPEEGKSLELAIVAGESCKKDLLNLQNDRFPQVKLFNEYGPTEATVWSSVYRWEADGGERVPIGRPIANTRIYLLDVHLNPVPVGVSGELYIGGIGLARGYLNRSELTAERFIPDPFREPGGRLYRTGDLARYRQDGNIEYLGRTDHQVKIRGFRIEPGEIEAVLGKHPHIREVVVVAREDTPGERRLVAYVARDKCCDRSAEGIDGLRAYLKEQLPEYMVPSAFVYLDGLPLTPNGKVDRKALPVPDMNLQVGSRYVAPRTATEEIVVNIWAEVLGLERVGIQDNFFELGGHSLLAIRMLQKIKLELKLCPSVAFFFQQPTIARLSAFLEGRTLPERIPSDIDLEAEASLDPVIQPATISTSVAQFQHDPSVIFLTGATGFLGAYLLHELLKQTSASVYCLVRAGSYQEGFTRLQDALIGYGICNPELMHKVFPVCGNLSEPQFGLSFHEFNALARKVDVIYHNGALVNFLQPYQTLKAVNVLGTQEVLRLACTQRVKPVHYISTLSVFGNELPSQKQEFTEEDFPDADANMGNGYNQSKWVAEKLIRIAADRGVPVSVYRPATVTGHSCTGIWNTDDFLCRLIRGCIDIGKAPAVKTNFDIVPVDYVSKAILCLSRQPQMIGKTFHLSNKYPVSATALVDWINDFGYSVQQEPYLQWIESVRIAAEYSETHPLYPLLPLFQRDVRSETDSQDMRKRYNSAQTEDALLNSEIWCPIADRDLFGIYLSFLGRNQLLT
ncbi:amino acid adenylation domain-containing protein [Nitrosomonas sp.]|uniref:amino acid adenylation domain-containing protein n=1 Tax=Nitrosomonas sp. TaxID=42353 RepID=UPI003305C2C9